jgi:two-component system response regulator HydG
MAEKPVKDSGAGGEPEIPGIDSALIKRNWNDACEHGRLQLGRYYLQGVLKLHDGQVNEAAKHAGVERESFYRLLRKHHVEPALYRGSKGKTDKVDKAK